MLRAAVKSYLAGQPTLTPCRVTAQLLSEQYCRRQGCSQQQHGLRRHRRLVQVCAAPYEAPALGRQQQRQQQIQTEAGGDGGGGGWGWGGGSGDKPPQGGGSGGRDDPEDDDGSGEPVSNPFRRVAMSIRLRQTADSWFLWRLAAAAAADVLAVLVVNDSCRVAPLSEDVLSQVLVTLLNTLVVGFAMEPFSQRVRAEMLVLRSDGSPAAASWPVSWPLTRHGSVPSSGPVLLAQRLLRQGLQLGLVGLLTGLAGSAAAQQIACRQCRRAAAEQRRDHGSQGGSHAGGSHSTVDGCRAAGEDDPRLQAKVVQRSALQRVLFMALSANIRHAALYAAEDGLGTYAGSPMVLHAIRALLHGANSLLAAAQWRHMSSHACAG